ncbi:NAD(P)-dependent dehydrogenase, short-chain alcohol dehydrogenase family [Actinacidiphila yanglinensis]|uniref:NAD(P)-dependent dehydrogenase, short-chain alcohol dehydrogenase family n=1 Tax=Actinacidiphila yanglinensis TaxID=310779 RepID=A0A1H6DS93_9ACTN|nr:SDR family oxidoreductase [Actinacidiphila yanglinensis]SEG88171.1 NAD(P)-dependent dehydrogenase, short-chain alcohol dehydrogenase family [Actinacidiphila yanglinensis]
MRVVIMGGTAGIGLATARALRADGAEVVVTGRNEERLAAAAAEGLTAERLDGTDEDAVAAFFERTGGFEHLVLAFSSGAVGLGPVKDTKLTDIRAAFEGKLFAYLFAVQHAQVTGTVTMVSAASARSGLPGLVGLAAVNGAIERIVSPLAADLAPVRVNAVSPGVIATDWWAFMPEEKRAAQFAAAAQSLPTGRVGTAEDVAGAIRYVIGADYVTGSILPVDGGFTVA